MILKRKHLEIIIESKLFVRPAISDAPEAVVAAGAAVHMVKKEDGGTGEKKKNSKSETQRMLTT